MAVVVSCADCEGLGAADNEAVVLSGEVKSSPSEGGDQSQPSCFRFEACRGFSCQASCGRGVRLEAAAPKAANPSSIIMPTPGSQQPTLTRQEGDLPEPRVAQQTRAMRQNLSSQGGGIEAERLVNARIAEGFAPRFCPLVDFSSSRTLRAAISP